eukprot:6660765-Pyramimonas_sp.AAC.1
MRELLRGDVRRRRPARRHSTTFDAECDDARRPTTTQRGRLTSADFGRLIVRSTRCWGRVPCCGVPGSSFLL